MDSKNNNKLASASLGSARQKMYKIEIPIAENKCPYIKYLVHCSTDF